MQVSSNHWCSILGICEFGCEEAICIYRFEDISFYLGMEVSHNAQEFEVTPVTFNVRANILSWRFELVCLVQATKAQGDHTDTMPEEEEVYYKLLRDLESSFDEED